MRFLTWGFGAAIIVCVNACGSSDPGVKTGVAGSYATPTGPTAPGAAGIGFGAGGVGAGGAAASDGLFGNSMAPPPPTTTRTGAAGAGGAAGANASGCAD